MRSGCGYGVAWAALLCASCIPPRLVARDGAAGAGGAAGASGDDGATAGTAGAAGAQGGQMTIQVTADVNDALWINGTDERLHYSATDPTIEVGTDAEVGRTGLRFHLSLPAGVAVTSATLRLVRETAKITTPSTMTVQVYDSVDVPPFDDTHDHLPQDHDGNHLWGHTVSGFMVCGANGETCASPNLADLVQRVIDKTEWTGTGWIGFVLSPAQDDFTPDGWVSFWDSFSGSDGASLELAYAPHP